MISNLHRGEVEVGESLFGRDGPTLILNISISDFLREATKLESTQLEYRYPYLPMRSWVMGRVGITALGA